MGAQLILFLFCVRQPESGVSVLLSRRGWIYIYNFLQIFFRNVISNQWKKLK